MIGVLEEESKVDVNEQEQLYPARRGRGRVHVCRARWDDAVRGALTSDVIVVCESGSCGVRKEASNEVAVLATSGSLSGA